MKKIERLLGISEFTKEEKREYYLACGYGIVALALMYFTILIFG